MRVKTRRNEGDMPGGQGGVPSAASSRRGLHVVPEASTEIVGERASSTGVLLFSAVVFLLAFGLALGAWWAIAGIGVAAISTALRDAIGRASVAEVAIRREQLDRELKRVLEEKVAPWGITVLSVEIRDILLPKELQDVMSLEAQAEQRKKARIILMEAEQDICEMMDDMGDTYAKNDAALRLRAMHLLYESVRETGGTVVVPSSFSEGFGDVLGDAAKDVLGKGSGL